MNTLSDIWMTNQEELLSSNILDNRVALARVSEKNGTLSQTEAGYVRHPKFDIIMKQDFHVALKQLDLECAVSHHLNEFSLGKIVDSFAKETLIASGGDDGTIRIWDLGDCTSSSVGRQLKMFPDCQTTISVLIHLHNGTYLSDGLPNMTTKIAAASGNGEILIWDFVNGGVDEFLDTHRNILSMIQLTDGRLVSGASGGRIIIRNVNNTPGFAMKTILKGHSQGIPNPVFSLIQLPDTTGRCLVASNCSNITVWDVTDVSCLVFTPIQEVVRGDHSHGSSSTMLIYYTELNHPRLICPTSLGYLNIWDIVEGRLTNSKFLGGPHIPFIISAVLLNQSKDLISIHGDSSIRKWSLETGGCKLIKNSTVGRDSDLSISWQSKLLQLSSGMMVSRSHRNDITVYDIKTFKISMSLKGHTKRISSIIELR
jgi:WD40 repeat protein